MIYLIFVALAVANTYITWKAVDESNRLKKRMRSEENRHRSNEDRLMTERDIARKHNQDLVKKCQNLLAKYEELKDNLD